MNKYLAVTAKLTVLSAALLAAGCGGGGSSGAAAVETPAPVAERSVTGVASKGTIKKARVAAYSLDAQGNKSAAAIAVSVTADDGSYTVKVPATLLTFVIQVEAAPGATMADEATGQDIDFPADMKLRNVVKLAEAAETTVTSHVSPLTELVAQTAESATGGLTAANIAQSKTGVAAALGFDPEKVKPVNSNTAASASASQEERIQSLTLAAISKLAQDSKLGCTQAAPSARVGCVVREVAKSGTMSADKLTLGETLRAEMRQALVEVTNSATINQTGVASVAGLPSFAQGVVPTKAGTPTGIESTKKMVASLRTNVNAWADSAKPGGSLATQAEAVKADFDKAIGPLDKDMLAWMGITATGIEYFADFKAGIATAPTRVVYDRYSARAACTVYSDEAHSIPATSAADARNVSCSVTRIGYFTRGSATTRSYARVGTGITLTPVAGQENAFDYRARSTVGTVTENFLNGQSTSTPLTNIGTYGASPNDSATGKISFTKSGAQVASLTIAGMMPARFDEIGDASTDHQLWNVTATRSVVEGNLFNYALAGAFTSIKGGAPAGKLIIDAGSFALVQETANGDVAYDGVKELKLSLTGEFGSSKIVGGVHFQNFTADKSGLTYIPTKVVFTGSVGSAAAPLFSGTLSAETTGYSQFSADLPLSPTNFVKLNASLTGTLTVPARPPLVLSVSAANDSFTGHNETVQYNDGAVVINASHVDDGVNAPVVSISSADGVSVKLAQGDLLAVMKDDAKVAEINVKTGVITYVDGSFESLK